MIRCKWCNLKNEKYIEYHDKEWGVPVYDDQKLFEMLVLEGFQAGLSWKTILRKRSAFVKAFAGFDVSKVAAFDDEKVKLLMQDAGIVRNRLKIKAAIQNAKVFINIQRQWGSFSKYLWHWTDGKIVIGNGVNTRSKLSDQISKDLQSQEMKFVGTVIIYSFLQAVGVICDHQEGCFLAKNKPDKTKK